MGKGGKLDITKTTKKIGGSMTKAKITSLYESMMEESKANPMYSTVLENECLIVHRFANGRVSEKLTERDVESMASGERKVFFIDAGMGAGKTTWIFEGPLPKLKNKGKKIAYLVPRVSLAISIKEQLSKNDMDAMEVKRTLNEYGLQKQVDFKVMDILTYQSAFQLSCKDASEYGLIVFDEAHYFIEDAVFNRETKKQLEFLLNKFALVNKVFISATMEDVFDVLYQKCREISVKSCYKSVWYEHYYFERNFDYIRPKFFWEIKDLLEQIQGDDQKWLIFVDNLEKGYELEAIFNEKVKDSAIFFDAKAKEDERSLSVMRMITDETLETKIGILTSAFDVGINIKDKSVAIVIYSYTKTQFLQELGRKRINGQERVQLYVNIPEKKKLSNRMVRIQQDINRIIEKKDYYENNPMFNGYYLEHPFYAVDGEVTYNHYAIEKLKLDYKSYESILNTKEDSYEQGFIKTVLSWLEWSDEDIEIYLSENDTTDELRLQILNLINKVGRKMSLNQFEDFTMQLLKIHDLRADKRASRIGSIQAVNKVLKLVSYKAHKSNEFYFIEKL